MNEKKNPQLVSEDMLSSVSGGALPEQAFIAEYSVGQRVRFVCLMGDTKESFVPYEWIGTVNAVIQEPEGIFYKLELEEQARQIVGYPYMTLYYENIIGIA